MPLKVAYWTLGCGTHLIALTTALHSTASNSSAMHTSAATTTAFACTWRAWRESDLLGQVPAISDTQPTQKLAPMRSLTWSLMRVAGQALHQIERGVAMCLAGSREAA